MRKAFILLTFCRYTFRLTMTILKIIKANSIDASCDINEFGIVSLTVDGVAFLHNLTVFFILICQLKRYHHYEYKLKKNGLCMYFTVIYLNFMLYSIDQSFMTFCVDYREVGNCEDNVKLCKHAGLYRGGTLYVIFYLLSWIQLP